MRETSARLLRLLSLLQAQRDWTGPVLAARLGVSTRTVRADIERLRSLGYPVHSTPGVAGGYRLGTTLQPCLQCLGAIRLSPVRKVHVLAPDPLFRGVERARHLNDFIGSQWPDIVELQADEWSVLSLLLQTHVTTFWQVDVPGWSDALPSVAGLAHELVRTQELLDLAEAAAPLATVAESLWDRLGACVADVEQVASPQLDA
jgi:biotin operon repressor